MSELSVDYSWARPAPAAVKAAGYTAVWRYLSGGTEGKDLTAAEAASLHAAGLGIGCVWETTAQRALGGADAGAADGRAAAAQAKAVGLPAGCPLLVNVGDFAADEAQLTTIESYYHAFRQATEATWQTGGYATGYIIDGLVARGAQGLWWQNAENDAGVAGDVVSEHAGVYQRVTRTRPLVADARAGDYDEDVTVNGAAVHWWEAPAADEVTIPVTYGKRAADAITAIQAVGLHVATSPPRNAAHEYESIESDPVGGTKVRKGSTITLKVKIVA